MTFVGQSNIVAGNGLSASFAVTTQGLGRVTIPIECAVGGTYIDEWQRGQPLYESCMAKMKIHPPKAIIWSQGEADSHEQALADVWSIKFERMIGDMRRDLSYEIPVIYMVQAGVYGTPAWMTIRLQQQNIRLDRAYSTDIDFASKYHPINSDGNVDVHYSREGYTEIGKALAYQYLEFVP